MFEKRIELILEADIEVDRDKLRKALTELVKENDSMKRALDSKSKEIKKQSTDLTKMQSKVTRLNKKIEVLSKNKKGSKPVNMQSDDYESEAKLEGTADAGLSDDALNLLQGTIPLTLDFRTSSLKQQYSGIFKYKKRFY